MQVDVALIVAKPIKPNQIRKILKNPKYLNIKYYYLIPQPEKKEENYKPFNNPI